MTETVRLRIAGEGDLIAVRQLIRSMAQAARFGTIDETKLVTASSELARNIVRYAGPGGGVLSVEVLKSGGRVGVRAVFADEGPGIADVSKALLDGYSSGGSLGVGLPGSRRLVDEFDLQSTPGRGTIVTVVKWKQR